MSHEKSHMEIVRRLPLSKQPKFAPEAATGAELLATVAPLVTPADKGRARAVVVRKSRREIAVFIIWWSLPPGQPPSVRPRWCLLEHR
jgi:hypothetical protein